MDEEVEDRSFSLLSSSICVCKSAIHFSLFSLQFMVAGISPY